MEEKKSKKFGGLQLNNLDAIEIQNCTNQATYKIIGNITQILYVLDSFENFHLFNIIVSILYLFRLQ